MKRPQLKSGFARLRFCSGRKGGSPEGRSDEFWIQAQQQLATEPGMGSAGSAPERGPYTSA
ncbi:hypothetical protein AWB80_08314 [Caballeronia pedi]|uniref:DUF2934 domain-containing protein n=1 Tax=Caballeronia pedi TaxID=1777141 RepID=A0A158E5S5_9BURK|nr:DUF2934 domain-containing protein [Caballeronia pedi]SAL02251.1 hypothetical protein AWB80_08314 [Caballeronia pedi]